MSEEPAAARELRFFVLGSLAAQRAGQALPLGGRLRRALLADLLLHAGEVLPVDRLVEDLWGPAPPNDPLNTLQVYVGQLRRLLEPDRRSRTPAQLLVSVAPGYQLVVDGHLVDALDFEARVRAARGLLVQGRSAQAGPALHDALRLWRGQVLPEFIDASWARARIARLEELRLGALESRLECDLAAGQHDHVIAELEALTGQAPFRERLWELRVLALYRAGRQADALAAYAQVRQLFRDELGIDPGAALRDLERAVLAQDPALVLAPTLPISVRAVPTTAGALVGRRDECAQLERLLADAAEGASLAFVTGEAGTGKSRLVAELATRAWAGGVSVASGRCFEGASAPAFAPVLGCLVELARASDSGRLQEAAPAAAVVARLLPDLADVFGELAAPTPLPPAEDRLRLYDAAGRMLVILTRGAPALLVLDDLHWADDGSLSLLAYLLRVARPAPLLLVGCYRAGEVPAGSEVARGLAAMEREVRASRLALPPLADEDAAVVVRQVLGAAAGDGLVARVVARGDGHPFFLREIARMATDGNFDVGGVPPAAGELVVRRLQAFPESARRLAEAASVFDGPWQVAVAAVAAGMEGDEAADAVDQLILGGLVIPTVAACEFVHDIARQAVYASLTPPRRARLHRAAARSMEQLWSLDRQHTAASELAHHYRESVDLGPDAAGAEHAERAAAAAEALSDSRDAVRLLQLALDLVPAADAHRLPRLRARRGRALLASGQVAAGLQELAEVLPRIQDVEGPNAAATILADAAETAGAAAHWSAAAVLARRGLELVPDDCDPEWSRLATTALLAEGIEDPHWPGIIFGTPEQARLSAAVRRLPSPERPPASVFFRAFASRDDVVETAADEPGALAFWAGDYRRALALALPRAEQAEQSGQLEVAMVHAAIAARCHTALGEFVEADGAFAQGVGLAGRLTAPSVFAGFLVTAEQERWVALGEGWGEFRFDASAALDERQARWYGVAVRAFGARVMAHLGATDQAMAHLEPLLEAVDAAPGWAENYPAILFAATEVHWLARRADHTELLARNAAEKVLEADFRYPMTDVRLTLARLAAVRGRDDEALDWFAQARAVLNEQGALPLSVVLDHDEAVVQLRTGHRREASFLHARALAAAEELGMKGWARVLAATSRPPASGRPMTHERSPAAPL